MALHEPPAKINRHSHSNLLKPPSLNKPILTFADNDCLKTPTMNDMMKVSPKRNDFEAKKYKNWSQTFSSECSEMDYMMNH